MMLLMNPVFIGRIRLKEFICFALLFVCSSVWAQVSAPKNLTAEEKQQIIQKFASEGDTWDIIWGKYLESKNAK